MRLDPEISKRIAITKYVMIIGVVIVHIPPYLFISQLGDGWIDSIKMFFAHAFFKSTVPMLSAISGYLVFKSKLHLNYLRLIRKKSKSILLPLLMWNIPFALIIYISQKNGMGGVNFWVDLHPFDPSNWMRAVFATTGTPVNAPLHFLRDIFVIMLMSPIIWLFLKRIPHLGLLIILSIFLFDLDGMLVLRDTMFITFYVGALAATQNWNLTYLDKYGAVLISMFFIACVFVTMFRITNIDLLIIMTPFLIWPAMTLISNSKFGDILHKYSNSSFLLFLSHVPIMFLVNKIYLAGFSDIPYIVFYCTAPLIAIIAVIPIFHHAHARFPNTSQLMLGGRQ